MTTFLLVALFAAIAAASALTIADAAVRGRSALRLLRGELARNDAVRMITVTMDGAEGPRMPALRQSPLSAVRSARRCAVRAPERLRAAA
jgi:hypothetical protein